jgi:hypothetical protein
MHERDTLVALLKNTQIREIPLELYASQNSKVSPPPVFNNKVERASQENMKPIPPVEYVESKEQDS